MRKRTFAMLILLMVLMIPCSTQVFAKTIAKGKVNSKISWTLDSKGKLTVSGKGKMPYLADGTLKAYVWGRYTDKIKSVEVKKGITHIADLSFAYCEKLKSVSLPAGLQSIGIMAFYECYKLEEIKIPSDVKNIEESAFAECTKLKEVKFPAGLEKIGGGAFYGCAIKTIELPAGLKTLSGSAFNECSELKSITVDKKNKFFCMQDGILYNKNKKKLIRYPEGKSGSSFKVPDNVTTIGEYAFAGCKKVKEFSLEGKVTSIEEWAFSSCKNLKKITLGERINKIDEFVFDNCNKLKDIVIKTKKLTKLNTSDSAFSLIHEDDEGIIVVYIPKEMNKEYHSLLRECGLQKQSRFTIIKERRKK